MVSVSVITFCILPLGAVTDGAGVVLRMSLTELTMYIESHKNMHIQILVVGFKKRNTTKEVYKRNHFIS